MKKYYFLLLFCSTLLSAQNVIIPNANFKTKLLSASPSNLVAFSGGIAVKIDTNNDNEIQLSEAVVIDSLDLRIAGISNLEGINDFLNLKKLVCNNNQLTTLDVSGLAFLKRINANSNQLTTVNLTANTQLIEARLQSNQLSSINLNNLLLLKKLYAGGNNLTTIDVSTLPALQILDVSSNLLTTLDCSQNLNLKGLFIATNQLTTVFIKNGSDESQLTGSGSWMENWISFNNPLLEYICTDENQVASIQNFTDPGVVVNSYCSFTPGGDFTAITGTTRVDVDENGCDLNDIIVPFTSFIVAKDGVDTNSNVYGNYVGNYALYTSQTGTYTLTPNLENPNYFIVSPNPATIPITQIDNSTTTQDFCITANGIHPDLEVVLVPVIPARPGFDAIYKIVYKNKGNQTVNGIVFFDFNDAFMDYVIATPLPSSTSVGYYGFNFTDLAPFETRSILVGLNINSPTETNPVNIGDVLEFNASVTLTSGATSEAEIDDNLFTLNQTVVGSYDPNDITCLQGNSLPTTDIGTYLHYNIRFENTGTAAAQNIVVKNEIDLAQYDIQSLQVMESSHSAKIKMTGNILEYIFQDINLETGGHGNILLKIKSKTSLPNNEVLNNAKIYFDYNFPILTNDEQTVFNTLSVGDFGHDSSLQMYPNPAQDILNISSANTINSIQLYDAQGRLLSIKLGNKSSEILDISKYSAGIYFVSVVTSQGKKTQKIIKK